VASSAPVQRHIRIQAEHWPAGRPPVRLILLSDLHVSWPGNSVSRFSETAAQVNAQRPDLVLIAGDFVSNAWGVRRESLSGAVAVLSKLRARLGIVAVPGNVDQPVRPVLIAELARQGVVVLQNRAVRRGTITVVGLDDHSTGHQDVAKALTSARQAGGWPVYLSHSPYAIWGLPAGGGLLLAGYTHCGQISLPYFGGVATPRSLERYDCGVVRDEKWLTIVSAGLGVSILPFRLGAPPDYWVIDIGNWSKSPAAPA